ncbi:ProQ/FINO family protein [Hydrogenophaga defluvii]|uniref:ProQ/FINO family protein n=1 Tax=Hydrogenophaga defluvii TaxID=249410 RepID=A0ABW2SEB4_9BURK
MQHTDSPTPPTHQRTAAGNRRRPSGARPAREATPPKPLHPVLAQLAELYPALFGEVLRPLKRGIFQDLLDAQPEVLDKEGLKAALALHTRSTRYLSAVASGAQRHDLSGQPVEALLPEQVHHALVEVFRRRQTRTAEDLSPKFRQRVEQAFEQSGLSREAYAEKVLGRDEQVNALTLEALAEVASRQARDEALRRAFSASGLSEADFASSYGMPLREVMRALGRAAA